MTKCALYRHFDEFGVLLYVGISDDPASRTRGHIAASPWVEFAAHGSVTWYRSRTAAVVAETHAIEAERPVWNGTGTRAAEREARVTEYLYRRGMPTHEMRRRAPRPRSTSPELVCLRGAAETFVVKLTHEALKKARARDPRFPVAVGSDGAALLYSPASLQAWESARAGGGESS